MQFHQPESAYVEFDFLIARGASIGVYGRKNAVPTLTQNDLREVLAGVRTRNGRDANDISGNQVRIFWTEVSLLCSPLTVATMLKEKVSSPSKWSNFTFNKNGDNETPTYSDSLAILKSVIISGEPCNIFNESCMSMVKY